MVGDIFVGALLVFSGCINLLAIGAFWVTPSLRTTANRFVVNLLVVNFISCLILSPFAFSVNESSPTTTPDAVQNASFNDNRNLTKADNNFTAALNQTSIIEDGYSARKIENFLMIKYQSWSLDLVVALSVLSVLLVVMDTFIAVTDPLRYHSRISDLKAWFLIAFCWVFGISFGIASALRKHEEEFFLSSNLEKLVDNNVYNTMFLLTYFLAIIIIPFLLVILMYWRIYSEARESGQRMRQNGSSPLLQSALNLAATATAHQQQSTILTNPQCLLLVTSSPQTNKHPHNALNKQQTSDSSSYFHQPNQSTAADGLTMKIDKQDYYGVINNNNINQQINLNANNHLSYINNGAFSDTKTFLLSSPPHELMPMLSTIDETSATSVAPKSQQHQNILLTLTTACDPTMKRNHSAKHLLEEENMFIGDLRQVRSTPNLQKQFYESSSELLSHQQEQTLELPSSIQASPKALRYMTSLRHRLSNASSLFKYREEGRAARISILVVIMFLLTYFPFGLLSLIHGQDSILKESNITLLSILFVLLANVCSPIIFAYRNKRVRRGVRRLLGIDKKTNERLEKLNSLKRSCSSRIKNYRQNNLHKSLNLGFKGSKANNIRRTQSFVTCKYLTPPDASKIALNGSYSEDHHHHHHQQQQQKQHQNQNQNQNKEKKSILKIVCDSSRKFGCQFSNCQSGQQEPVFKTTPVEV